jgi:hypothetical protein
MSTIGLANAATRPTCEEPVDGIDRPLPAGARRESPRTGLNHANRMKTAHPEGPHPSETNRQHEERLSCPTNA